MFMLLVVLLFLDPACGSVWNKGICGLGVVSKRVLSESVDPGRVMLGVGKGRFDQTLLLVNLGNPQVWTLGGLEPVGLEIWLPGRGLGLHLWVLPVLRE